MGVEAGSAVTSVVQGVRLARTLASARVADPSFQGRVYASDLPKIGSIRLGLLSIATAYTRLTAGGVQSSREASQG